MIPRCVSALCALNTYLRSLRAAGEDATDDPVPGADVLPSAVLRRHALHPNEREEAHLGVSCL